jgi:hypothetical protein
MPPPDDRDAFEAAFRATVAAVLPSATVEVVARMLVLIKLRVDLDADRFIDVFFNSRNRRTDLSLIEGGRRVFGYDNLGDWHCHPPEAPELHVACSEPNVGDFIRAAVALSRKT